MYASHWATFPRLVTSNHVVGIRNERQSGKIFERSRSFHTGGGAQHHTNCTCRALPVTVTGSCPHFPCQAPSLPPSLPTYILGRINREISLSALSFVSKIAFAENSRILVSSFRVSASIHTREQEFEFLSGGKARERGRKEKESLSSLF